MRSTEVPGALAVALLLVASTYAPSARAQIAYVSDELANVVHVIDPSQPSVSTSIAVGRRPRGMQLSADGKRLYVASGSDNRIDVIDLATRRVIDHLPSGPDPERFVLSPDGRWLYVANEDDNTVSFVDIAARRIVHAVAVGAEPEGMAVSPDGRWVVCTSESASLVHFIDAASATLVDSVMVGTRPRDAQFSEDGRQLWVSSETRASVTVFAMPSRKPLHTIDFDADDNAPDTVQAVGVVLRPGRAFVALGRGNAVAEVDPATFAIRRYFPAGSRDWGIAVSGDGKWLFAANGLSGNVSVIDLMANRPAATIATGGKPWGVVAAP